MYWLLVLIIGFLIGTIAGTTINKKEAMRWIGDIAAGLVGSWIGQVFFGSWGPQFYDVAIFPSIIGALILVLMISFFLRK
ncbi:membrane protein [Oenococcus oeni IOEB_C23]|uniref:GlsB/YeaQ/YmgE family stress response membrane protein n=1 Tax=Oenococcus oeni TaxID=1247 RepID=UPI00050FB35E|nr:GlsB/YeaQ/YmgE family stress response membrane protein [Oenococcus oeni]KGH64597.1 membrane protein [Oenococcus oeni IOEB_C23]